MARGTGTPASGASEPRRAVRKPSVESDRISSGEKHLAWIPVAKMRISPRAQRKHNSPSSRQKIDMIASGFDPDKFGTPTVNLRDDIYWIIDGGHRVLAIIQLGWEDQKLQCWVYEGLSEAEEADKFLSLNDVKAVSGMDKFQRALVAQRPVETDIDRIVRSADMTIGTGRDSIGCVGAVRRTYEAGPRILATTVRVLRDSYGVTGFSAKVTEGTGLFVANYENVFDEAFLIERLAAKKGGVAGLLGEAERIKRKYGVNLAVSVAAAIVETYNTGRGRPKLNGWWSTFNGN